MKEEIKVMVEQYQCSGCVVGGDVECFEIGHGVGCSKHVPGTFIAPTVGSILLGLPTGFNRIGDSLRVSLFYTFKESQKPFGYEKYNIPVWMHLDEYGNTLIRGLSPRVNKPFLDIVKGDCRYMLNCLEITKDDLDGMD